FRCRQLAIQLWCPKRGKGPLEDREIRCTRCNWRTTDSARATSTSNMRFHLTKHGIFSNGSESGLEDDRSSTKQPSTPVSSRNAEDNAGKFLERNLVRWVVLNNMAFDAIESPASQQIFQDLRISIRVGHN
ncbi:hypothetical protein V1508DRAFT_361164, partial [Lipomyces doorenjongii]|uniref:uncharacterized protein n=1 Tax=Lipomyces doorenjongii TaxID=383834 RepID=UPI0034CE799E